MLRKDVEDKHLDEDGLVTIHTTKEWLRVFQTAVFQNPLTGEWMRVGWVEPLVRSGHVRLAIVPVGEELIGVEADGSEYFSDN